MPLIDDILRKLRPTKRFLDLRALSKKYLRSKGWLKSAELGLPVSASGEPLPWLTYSAIHFLDQRLKTGNFKIFEYGSGNSTIWFAERAQVLVSVENSKEYYDKLHSSIYQLKNVEYHLITSLEDYVRKIKESQIEFDIVIIDGKERNLCAQNAVEKLNEKGIIVWDNTDRKIYDDGLSFLAEKGFKRLDFVGLSPGAHSETQTTIFYRSNNCFGI